MAKTTKNIPARNMDEYIAGFPENIQKMLEDIRATIRKTVPEAKEAIKYDIPTFTLNGNLVSFGAWKNHIGLYPVPRTAEQFKKELSAYDGAKSTVKFFFDDPLPLALIKKIVKFNAERNSKKAGISKDLQHKK